MPLLFTSDLQVNAMVPYGLPVNTSHQIFVQRGPTLSRPVAVNLAAAQPAVFPTMPGGSQGHIYKAVDGAQVLAEGSSPAAPGDVLVIYCSGLGEVEPAVEAGQPAGASPLSETVNDLTVLIDGRQARVLFAGLTPGFSGLYQVNVVVPEGVSSSSETPVTLTIAGQTSGVSTFASAGGSDQFVLSDVTLIAGVSDLFGGFILGGQFSFDNPLGQMIWTGDVANSAKAELELRSNASSRVCRFVVTGPAVDCPGDACEGTPMAGRYDIPAVPTFREDLAVEGTGVLSLTLVDNAGNRSNAVEQTVQADPRCPAGSDPEVFVLPPGSSLSSED